MIDFDFFIPTRILFGAGKLNRLATEPLPGKKALIVISSGQSMKKHGYLDQVVSLLRQNGVASVVFDKILPNPVRSHVMEAAALAKKESCDFVIGLGGGSSIDSAKSIAVMATNPGDYWDYISGGSGGGKPVEHQPLPIVAITTTAGTGSEADPWTVISKDNEKEKIGFGLLPETMPTLSIIDPQLMTTIPPKLTAYQGFDALFHSTEGYMSSAANPMSDLFALKSISLIFKSLPAAIWEGENLDARADVALANTLSGMVESISSCMSEHSMEHALSAFHPDLPHGAGLIMLSEAYHSLFTAQIPDRLIDMARAAGVDTNALPPEKRAGAFVDALIELQKKCGVYGLRMSDFGIKKSELPVFVKNARETMGGLYYSDPCTVSDEDVLSIYEKSYL